MSVRFSKTLSVGASSLALFWISVGMISMGVVRAPWDLIVVVLLLSVGFFAYFLIVISHL